MIDEDELSKAGGKEIKKMVRHAKRRENGGLLNVSLEMINLFEARL